MCAELQHYHICMTSYKFKNGKNEIGCSGDNLSLKFAGANVNGYKPKNYNQSMNNFFSVYISCYL